MQATLLSFNSCLRTFQRAHNGLFGVQKNQEIQRALVHRQRRFLGGFTQGRVRMANAGNVFGCWP
jgi:hypothetical protein